MEYYGELVTADEGYRRENHSQDNSVYRYFLKFEDQNYWYVDAKMFLILLNGKKFIMRWENSAV